MYAHQEETPTNNTETSQDNQTTPTRDTESEPCILDTDKVVSGSPGGGVERAGGGGTHSSAEAGVLTPNLRPSTKAPNPPPLDTLSDEGLKGDENVDGEWSGGEKGRRGEPSVHARQRGDESVMMMDAVEVVLKPRLASDRCPSLSLLRARVLSLSCARALSRVRARSLLSLLSLSLDLSGTCFLRFFKVVISGCTHGHPPTPTHTETRTHAGQLQGRRDDVRHRMGSRWGKGGGAARETGDREEGGRRGRGRGVVALPELNLERD